MSFQIFNIQGTILQAQLVQNLVDAQQADLISRDAQRAYELRREARKAEEQIDHTTQVEHAIVRREDGQRRRQPRRRPPGAAFDVVRPESLPQPEEPEPDGRGYGGKAKGGEGHILDITV